MIMLIPCLSYTPDKPEAGPVHIRGSTTGPAPSGQEVSPSWHAGTSRALPGQQPLFSVSEIPVPPPQSPGGPASSGGPSRVVNPLAAGDDGGTSPAELISGGQHMVEGCVSDHPEAGVPTGGSGVTDGHGFAGDLRCRSLARSTAALCPTNVPRGED